MTEKQNEMSISKDLPNNLKHIIDELLTYLQEQKNLNVPEMQRERLKELLISLGYPRDLINNIDRLLNHVGLIYHEAQKDLKNQSPEEQRRKEELAIELIKCAKDDTKAVETLYERKLFPLAVYHLQQAVEKTTKAYALVLPLTGISRKKLKKIGHKSPMVFVKLLRKSWIEPLIEIVKILNPQIKTNVGELERVINEGQEELAKIPKKEVVSTLTVIKELRDNYLPNLMRILQPIFSLFGVKEDERKYNLLVSFFITLYLLSAITYPHFNYTRYPDDKIKPADYYSGKIEIVECIEDILKEVELCIDVFEQIYESKEGVSYAA